MFSSFFLRSGSLNGIKKNIKLSEFSSSITNDLLITLINRLRPLYDNSCINEIGSTIYTVTNTKCTLVKILMSGYRHVLSECLGPGFSGGPIMARHRMLDV